MNFRGPSETHIDSLVGHALFGDGAAAVIVGSDPMPELEKPSQTAKGVLAGMFVELG